MSDCDDCEKCRRRQRKRYHSQGSRHGGAGHHHGHRHRRGGGGGDCDCGGLMSQLATTRLLLPLMLGQQQQPQQQMFPPMMPMYPPYMMPPHHPMMMAPPPQMPFPAQQQQQMLPQPIYPTSNGSPTTERAQSEVIDTTKPKLHPRGEHLVWISSGEEAARDLHHVDLWIYGADGVAGPLTICDAGCTIAGKQVFNALGKDKFVVKFQGVGEIFKIRLEAITSTMDEPDEIPVSAVWSVIDARIIDVGGQPIGRNAATKTTNFDFAPGDGSAEGTILTGYKAGKELCVERTPVNFEESNDKGELRRYIVEITTGGDDKASTRRHIRMKVVGSRGDWGWRPLLQPVVESGAKPGDAHGSKKKIFDKPGKKDVFSVEAVDLGELEAVWLCCGRPEQGDDVVDSDQPGPGQGWMCQQVVIRESVSSVSEWFVAAPDAGRWWFDLGRDDRCLQRRLQLSRRRRQKSRPAPLATPIVAASPPIPVASSPAPSVVKTSPQVPQSPKDPMLTQELAYEIIVWTSDRQRAEFTAGSVQIEMAGDNATSDNLSLSKSQNQRPFKRAQMDVFKLCQKGLGAIKCITLGHIMKGRGNGWHCQEVQFEDPFTNKMLSFPCDRWLDAAVGPATLSCSLFPVWTQPRATRAGGRAADKYLVELMLAPSSKFAERDATLVLVGEHGEMKRTLNKDLLQPGSEMSSTDGFTADYSFQLNTGEVGPLRKIRLEDDGQTDGGNWEVKEVRMTDRNAGDFLSFNFERYGFEYANTEGMKEMPVVRYKEPTLRLTEYIVTLYPTDESAGTSLDLKLTLAGKGFDSGRRKYKLGVLEESGLRFTLTAVNMGPVERVGVICNPQSALVASAAVREGVHQAYEEIYSINTNDDEDSQNSSAKFSVEYWLTPSATRNVRSPTSALRDPKGPKQFCAHGATVLKRPWRDDYDIDRSSDAKELKKELESNLTQQFESNGVYGDTKVQQLVLSPGSVKVDMKVVTKNEEISGDVSTVLDKIDRTLQTKSYLDGETEEPTPVTLFSPVSVSSFWTLALRIGVDMSSQCGEQLFVWISTPFASDALVPTPFAKPPYKPGQNVEAAIPVAENAGDPFKVRLGFAKSAANTVLKLSEVRLSNAVAKESAVAKKSQAFTLQRSEVLDGSEEFFLPWPEACELPLVAYKVALTCHDELPAPGANCRVFLTLYGDRGDSGQRELRFAKNAAQGPLTAHLLVAGKTYSCQLRAVSLGIIRHAKLSVARPAKSTAEATAGAGDTPMDLYVAKIVVHDTEAGRKFDFPTNKWFSRTYPSDKAVERLLQVGREPQEGDTVEIPLQQEAPKPVEAARPKSPPPLVAPPKKSQKADEKLEKKPVPMAKPEHASQQVAPQGPKVPYRISVYGVPAARPDGSAGALPRADTLMFQLKLHGESGPSELLELGGDCLENAGKYVTGEVARYNIQHADLGKIKKIAFHKSTKMASNENEAVELSRLVVQPMQMKNVYYRFSLRDAGAQLSKATELAAADGPRNRGIWELSFGNAVNQPDILDKEIQLSIHLVGFTATSGEIMIKVDSLKPGEHPTLSKVSINKDLGHLFKARVGVKLSPKSKESIEWHCETLAAKHLDSGVVYYFINSVVAKRHPNADGVVEMPCINYRKDYLQRKYEVMLQTGVEQNTRLDSNVYVKLFGDRGDSGKRYMQHSDLNAFASPGRCDSSVVNACDLGTLTHLVVGHDDSGQLRMWHLDKIIVTSEHEKDTTYVFDSGDWYHKLKENSVLERILKPVVETISSPPKSTSDADASAAQHEWSVMWVTQDEQKRLANIPFAVSLYGLDGVHDPWRTVQTITAGMSEQNKIKTAALGDLYKVRVRLNYLPKDRQCVDWFISSFFAKNLKTNQIFKFDFDQPISRTPAVDGVKEAAAFTKKRMFPELAYEVTLTTGGGIDMDTDCNVYLTLVGQWGDSGMRWLLKAKAASRGKPFQRASVDTFVIKACFLGPVHEVIVGHNEAGQKRAWWLSQVEVDNPLDRNAKKTVFPCKEWLSRQSPDGNVERILTPNGEKKEDLRKKWELPPAVDGLNAMDKKRTARQYLIHIYTNPSSPPIAGLMVFFIIASKSASTDRQWLTNPITGKINMIQPGKVNEILVQCPEIGIVDRLICVTNLPDDGSPEYSWLVDQFTVTPRHQPHTHWIFYPPKPMVGEADIPIYVPPVKDAPAPPPPPKPIDNEEPEVRHDPLRYNVSFKSAPDQPVSKAQISVTFVGEKAASQPHLIDVDFRPGNSIEYPVKLEMDIGPLQRVKLGLGPKMTVKPKWSLQEFKCRHLATGKINTFSFGKNQPGIEEEKAKVVYRLECQVSTKLPDLPGLKVAVKIIGSKAMSGQVQLMRSDDGRTGDQLFCTGALELFTMELANLGRINEIKVAHNKAKAIDKVFDKVRVVPTNDTSNPAVEFDL